MSRHIDAEPIIKNLTAMKSAFDAIELDGMIKALKEAPTADVVEVVRCKDCRHFREHRYIPTGVPNFYCNWHEISVEKHDFCSYGERKESDE